jgi:uncharacterized protein (TIGR00369 family)
MSWGTERLEQLKNGTATLPPVVERLMLGGLDDWGDGWVRKTWTPRPELGTADGSIFGGYLAALADQALAFAAMSVVPEDKLFRTTNLQVSFLRIGRTHPLHIEAQVVAKTRQMIAVRATFRRPDGELIAEAAAQQLLMDFQAWPAEAAAKEAAKAKP